MPSEPYVSDSHKPTGTWKHDYLEGTLSFFLFFFFFNSHLPLVLLSPSAFYISWGTAIWLKKRFETVSAVLDLNIGKRQTNLSHFDIIDSFKTGLKLDQLLRCSWVSDWSGHILTRPYGLYVGFMGLLTFRPLLRESLGTPGTGLLTLTFFCEQVSAPLSGNPYGNQKLFFYL